MQGGDHQLKDKEKQKVVDHCAHSLRAAMKELVHDSIDLVQRPVKPRVSKTQIKAVYEFSCEVDVDQLDKVGLANKAGGKLKELDEKFSIQVAKFNKNKKRLDVIIYLTDRSLNKNRRPQPAISLKKDQKKPKKKAGKKIPVHILRSDPIGDFITELADYLSLDKQQLESDERLRGICNRFQTRIYSEGYLANQN